MNNLYSIGLIAVVGLTLSMLDGCASVINGVQQKVAVSTSPIQGASCSLQNDKGIWEAKSTPALVTIHRSYQNLVVHCRKPGYGSTTRLVQSKTKPIMYGYAIMNGIIGTSVDMATGAAYDYPTKVNVSIKQG